MRPKIRGNFGSYNFLLPPNGATQGLGVQQNNTPLGYASICGDTEHPGILQGTSVLAFKVDQGVWFQASGCDIDVEYTLEPWNYAVSPEANEKGLVHWCNKVAVAENTIVESDIRGFSAIKATFKGTGILYVIAR